MLGSAPCKLGRPATLPLAAERLSRAAGCYPVLRSVAWQRDRAANPSRGSFGAAGSASAGTAAPHALGLTAGLLIQLIVYGGPVCTPINLRTQIGPQKPSVGWPAPSAR